MCAFGIVLQEGSAEWTYAAAAQRDQSFVVRVEIGPVQRGFNFAEPVVLINRIWAGGSRVQATGGDQAAEIGIALTDPPPVA